MRRIAVLAFLLGAVAAPLPAQTMPTMQRNYRALYVGFGFFAPSGDVADLYSFGGQAIIGGERASGNTGVTLRFDFDMLAGEGDIDDNGFIDVLVGGRYYVNKRFYAGVEAGWFSGGELEDEFDVVPGIGWKREQVDLGFRYKALGDYTWFAFQVTFDVRQD